MNIFVRSRPAVPIDSNVTQSFLFNYIKESYASVVLLTLLTYHSRMR